LTDEAAIRDLAHAADEHAALRADVEEHGRFHWRPIQNSRGVTIGEERVPNPAIRAQRDLERTIGALCQSLGLTPEGRTRLGIQLTTRRSGPTALDELNERFRNRRKSASNGAR